MAAATVTAYLAGLSPERRTALRAVRRVIRKHLPTGYREGILYGMISWHVPLSRYPETHNGQPLSVVCLASQKQYISLHLPCVYVDPKLRRGLEQAFRAAKKKLNAGKGCVRFRSVEDVPLEAIGALIGELDVDTLVAQYEEGRSAVTARRGAGSRRKTARSA